MPNEPTDMHLPYTQARDQSEKVAQCQVCHTQWQIRTLDSGIPRGCPFCDAPSSAITIVSESPNYGGAIVV